MSHDEAFKNLLLLNVKCILPMSDKVYHINNHTAGNKYEVGTLNQNSIYGIYYFI